MKKDYTDIVVVLDRSGSMATIKNDMVNGLKSFVEKQKLLPGQCTMTLIQFDGQGYDTVFSAKAISDVPEIEMLPRGNTPLLDAVGRAINETGARLKALAENERPEFVIMMIITDGEENSSHEFTRDKIKEMTEHQISKYKWNFTYLGANQDGFSEARSMGIPVSAVLNYAANQKGVARSFDSVNLSTSNLRSHRCEVMAYNKSDYDAQADAAGTDINKGGTGK